MTITKRYTFLLMVFFITFSVFACSKKPQKPEPKPSNEPKPMPKVIEEMEKDILKVMAQADMVPYFERVIVEEQKLEEKKKIEQMKISNTNSQDQKSESQDQSNEEKQQNESQKQLKPMTIEEGVLTEILNREKTAYDDKKEEKPPKDITETWENINNTIKGLHNKWNVLEPLLIQQSISSEIIADFENMLDKLTNLGIEHNYFGTITTANKLTSYLPKFMVYYKKEIPPTIYTLKYYVRDIVLNTAVNNYIMAQKSLNQLKEQGESMKSQLIEKKAKSTADKFDASVTNLQKSVDKKDINLIKINAGIVMKNIILMKDDLATSK